MLEPWPHLAREELASFKFFDVEKITRRNPRTEKPHSFFVVGTADWINVIPFTENGDLVLVRQFRHGPAKFTLELPGGGVDPGEEPVAAARRELREESGYEAKELRYLGTVNPNPAIFGNSCGTVLATGCRRVAELEQDAGEDIEVVTMSKAEFRDAMRRGEVDHALVLAAFVWLELDDGDESLWSD